MPSLKPRSIRIVKALRHDNETRYFVSKPHRTICSTGTIKRGIVGFVNADPNASFDRQHGDLDKLKRILDNDVGRDRVFWYNQPRWAPQKDSDTKNWSMRILVRNEERNQLGNKTDAYESRTIRENVPTGGVRPFTEIVGVAAFKKYAEDIFCKSRKNAERYVEKRSHWVEWDIDELNSHQTR